MWRETNVLQEWKVFTFTDVVEVNPKRSLKKGEECQYIEMKSLLPNHRKVEKIDKRAYKGGGSRFRNGDTLFARITPCLENGKIAFINELDPDHAGHGSTEFIVMSGKEGVTDNLFVYYLSRWDEIREFAIKNMTGTSGRQRVPNDIFKQRKIYLPPLPEQHRIASLLSAFDDKIELNHQMNRTLEEMTSAIFKSWFVYFEPFRDGEFEYSEELEKEIPKGWVVKRLREIGRIVTGSTPSTRKSEYYGKDHPFIKIPDMRNNVFVIQTETKISKLGAENKREKILPPLAVCVSCIATPGLVSLTSANSLTNQQINSIICNEEISPYFVFLMMKNISNLIILGGSGGTATLNLNKGDFSNIKILIPDKGIIKPFNGSIEPIFSQILDNQKESLTLAQIRDALLPKLLSGEIRVNLPGNNNMFKEAEDMDQ